jgi:hypothetical protein
VEGRALDPSALMTLYKKAGARYLRMAVHHDNFDLWNSAHPLERPLAMAHGATSSASLPPRAP